MSVRVCVCVSAWPDSVRIFCLFRVVILCELYALIDTGKFQETKEMMKSNKLWHLIVGFLMYNLFI